MDIAAYFPILTWKFTNITIKVSRLLKYFDIYYTGLNLWKNNRTWTFNLEHFHCLVAPCLFLLFPMIFLFIYPINGINAVVHLAWKIFKCKLNSKVTFIISDRYFLRNSPLIHSQLFDNMHLHCCITWTTTVIQRTMQTTFIFEVLQL